MNIYEVALVSSDFAPQTVVEKFDRVTPRPVAPVTPAADLPTGWSRICSQTNSVFARRPIQHLLEDQFRICSTRIWYFAAQSLDKTSTLDILPKGRLYWLWLFPPEGSLCCGGRLGEVSEGNLKPKHRGHLSWGQYVNILHYLRISDSPA